MKTLYLTSEVYFVAQHIANDIGNPESKKLVFIITGAEPEGIDKDWVIKDRQGLIDAGFPVTTYTITGKNPEQIKNDLEEYDIIHVNGGKAYHILQQAEKSGFDKWIVEAVEKGKIYTGSSGGSISADVDIAPYYKNGETKKWGLGLVDLTIIPHWGRPDRLELNIKERLPQLFDQDHKIILLSDYEYVKIIDNQMQIIDVRKD